MADVRSGGTYYFKTGEGGAGSPKALGWLLRLVIAAAIFALLAAAAGFLTVGSPTLTRSLSSVLLKPQVGATQWNGEDRITVAMFGLTQRTTEPARTDTLLIMDIDPSRHVIHMLSVPRDLWVDIPGHGYGKLAIAYEIGGPRLATYTLERDLGIPVDYFMALTFRGFIRVVNAMGGVEVDVPKELNDPLYPCLVGSAYCPIDIKKGWHHMSGYQALEFVRERHAFAQQDLARVQDQQAFAAAVKSTLLSPLTWPRYPGILDALKSSLITNFAWNDLPELSIQYLLASKNQLTHNYINQNDGLVQPSVSSDGQDILVPTTSTGIPDLVHKLFSDPILAQQHDTVAVLNGTDQSGLAADVEGTLHSLGFNAVSTGNAASANYQHTMVIVNTSAGGSTDYTARRLQRVLDAQLRQQGVPGQSAQLVVILGGDFP